MILLPKYCLDNLAEFGLITSDPSNKLPGIFCSIRFHCSNVVVFPELNNYSGEYNVITTDAKKNTHYLNKEPFVPFFGYERSPFYYLLGSSPYIGVRDCTRIRTLGLQYEFMVLFSEWSRVIKAHTADECSTFLNDDLAAGKSNTHPLLLPNGASPLIESLCAGWNLLKLYIFMSTLV